MNVCKFNKEVDCSKPGWLCDDCGWNPEEEEKRIMKIKRVNENSDCENTEN